MLTPSRLHLSVVRKETLLKCPVLATWVIRRFFGILGGIFRHAILLFRPV